MGGKMRWPNAGGAGGHITVGFARNRGKISIYPSSAFLQKIEEAKRKRRERDLKEEQEKEELGIMQDLYALCNRIVRNKGKNNNSKYKEIKDVIDDADDRLKGKLLRLVKMHKVYKLERTTKQHALFVEQLDKTYKKYKALLEKKRLIRKKEKEKQLRSRRRRLFAAERERDIERKMNIPPVITPGMSRTRKRKRGRVTHLSK